MAYGPPIALLPNVYHRAHRQLLTAVDGVSDDLFHHAINFWHLARWADHLHSSYPV